MSRFAWHVSLCPAGVAPSTELMRRGTGDLSTVDGITGKRRVRIEMVVQNEIGQIDLVPLARVLAVRVATLSRCIRGSRCIVRAFVYLPS